MEAVAVLISKMPRMRFELSEGKLGECFEVKPDFMKVCLLKMQYSCMLLEFSFICRFLIFCRHGKNGGHKLLSSTLVNTGFSVITVRPGRA